MGREGVEGGGFERCWDEAGCEAGGGGWRRKEVGRASSVQCFQADRMKNRPTAVAADLSVRRISMSAKLSL